MLVYQKTKFYRYYCIKLFCHLKLWKKASKKSFLYYYNGAQMHEGFSGLKTPVRKQSNVTKLRLFLSTLLLKASILATA